MTKGERATLEQARQRCERLLEQLRCDAQELKGPSRLVSEQKLAEGRAAYGRAAAAAEALLRELDESLNPLPDLPRSTGGGGRGVDPLAPPPVLRGRVGEGGRTFAQPLPMTTTATDNAAGEAIVAYAGTYYRVTRYIFSAVMLAMGAWFAYDGYVTYPRNNELHRLHVLDPVQNPKDYPTHKAASIRLQKILGGALPAVGIGLLVWTLYNSRGEYRLAGDVLSVPGHPDVPLDYVTQIDKQQWDRKGIAYLNYALPTGQKGRIRLDDFVYDRPPTDRILETIEARLGVTADGGTVAQPNASDDSSNASS